MPEAYNDHDGGDIREAFIDELTEKSVEWRRIRDNPILHLKTRSGDVIKDIMDTCRRCGLELHPTILIAAV